VSFIAPQQVITPASSWTVTDYITRSARSSAAAAGVCQVQLPELDQNQLWLITHAVVSCTSSTPTTVRWYAGSVLDLNLLDGSGSGNFDIADWPNGLQLQPTTSLIVQWTGASAGAIGTVTLQARTLRR